MAIQRPKRPVFPKTGLFWPKNDHNSENLQNRYANVYIFGISIKFRVDEYAGIGILKMFQKIHNKQVMQVAGGPWEAYSPYLRPNMGMIR